MTTTTYTAAAAIAAYQNGSPIGPYAVVDTEADVLASLGGLETLATARDLCSLTLSDPSNPIAITGATWDANRSALSVNGTYSVTITGAAASDAWLDDGTHVASVSFIDSAANVLANLGSFASLGRFNEPYTITLTDSGTPNFALTESQWVFNTGVFANIQGNFTLTVSGSDANSAAAAAGLSQLTSISVVDTENGVRNAIDGLETLASQGKLTSITMTDGTTTPLAISASQVTNDATALALIVGSYSIAASGATAANAASVSAQSHVSSVAIQDSSANLAANLDALETLAAAGRISQIVQTDFYAMTLTEQQVANDAAALAKFTFYGLDETGISAAQAGTVIYQPHVDAIGISDTAANISANIATIQTLATALKVSNITVTDGGTIRVTDTVYNVQTNWRAFLTGTYSIAISGVAYGSASSRLLDPHVSTISIADTATYLSWEFDNLELMAKSGRLAGISFTDSGTPTLSITAAQITSDADALALITSPYGLSVTGVTVANAAAIAAAAHVSSVSVSDTLANIAAGLSTLDALVTSGKVSSVAVSDYSQTLALTQTEWSEDQAVLAVMSGNFRLVLENVTVAAALSASTAQLWSVTVNDSAADVATHLDALQTLASHGTLTSITLTDSGTPTLSLTASQLSNDSQALKLISSNYNLATSSTETVSAVITQSSSGHGVTGVSIVDSAANVAAGLDQLQADVAGITGITLTDAATPTLSVSSTQLAKDAGVLAAISSPYTLVVNGVSIANLPGTLAQSKVVSVAVTDTAADLSADLDGLQSLMSSGKVTGVAVSDGITASVTVTQTQLTSDSLLLNSLTGPSGIGILRQVQGATAAQAIVDAASSQVRLVSVSDSAANVVANMSSLETLAVDGKLGSISLTDAGTPTLSLSDSQLLANPWVLNDITGSYRLAVTNAPISVFAPLIAAGHVASGTVADTAINVSNDLDGLENDLAAGTLTGISLTDGGTATVSLAAVQLTRDAPVLAAITSPYTLSVSNVTVADLPGTLALPKVVSVGVTDMAANIAADFDGLQALLSAGKLTGVFVSGGGILTLTQTQITNDAALLNQLTGGGFSIVLEGVTAAGAAGAASANHVTSVSVSDSAANVVANIAALEALAQSGHLTSITLTDAETPALALSAPQLIADAQVLADIASPFTVAATGLSVSAFLSPDNQLSSASIADNTANVLDNLDLLQASVAAGKLTSIALTDGGTPSFVITDGQLTSDAQALHDIVGSFSLAISGVPTASLSAVLATNHVASAGVTDSAANIGTDLDSLQSLISSGKVTSIVLTDSGTPTLTVTAAQMVSDAQAINDIAGAYTLNVTGDATDISQLTPTVLSHVKSLSVTDSAANIAGELDSLQSLAAAGKLTSVAVSGTSFADLTISASQLASDASALKDITGDYVLDINAAANGGSIAGIQGHGNIVTFSGSAGDYTIAASASGNGVTVTDSAGTEQLSGIDAIQIGAQTDYVAATPLKGGMTDTGNLTELYGAVFSRTPDVAGLGFYEAYLANNPNTPLLQFAQWFLDSTEYQTNPAHAYAQTSAGETQFISDSYENLLHRTPSSDEVNFYLTNVIQPALNGLQAGSAAYAAADAKAHALLLVYFSASPEFLGDVQITAQNPSSAQHWLLLTN
jgi:hypothetical protein